MTGPRHPRSVPHWSLQDAKNKLSAVVDAAARGIPQIVTRRGVETAVVISYDEYERISSQRRQPSPSLAEYLLDMPGAPQGEEEIERIELLGRDADL